MHHWTVGYSSFSNRKPGEEQTRLNCTDAVYADQLIHEAGTILFKDAGGTILQAYKNWDFVVLKQRDAR